MKKEWFAAKELTGKEGLPTSTQGVHGMARRLCWVKRRRRGVQGRAVEYHIDSLPGKVVAGLTMNEQSAEYVYASHQDPLAIWIESYKQMKEPERETMISFILREGVAELLNRLRKTDEP
ncbi:DNA-binding protein [Rahnella sp. AA]|uniref:DNA-binding protein n=1 Tax=Rahnella sp. AA TaxID=2057180 RepID=UPI000C3302E6|nr:DNA-binding protein [Rahnella sp. AA]PKE29158.1 DNA-binding protein [Rahnella sp. AA]